MKVDVYHKNELFTSGPLTHVASVLVSDQMRDRNDHEYETSSASALEYAWRWTNNVDGSWSMPSDLFLEYFGEQNTDHNSNVTVQEPLPRSSDGKQWGIRSSSVGDIFLITYWNNKTELFECENTGFKWLINT